ncbi:phospholipid/cholesterol/gamma-HCH transport system substrate-binding protein [Prauserella shujinwangii]|uniref:Phospholipid/cholesterol/gamma-HCH transport system substrate-binding protein n=1 Tax=Prauserella shujinwangii TaxID=1453103 RepID=A0A2T0LLS2_9PSEU|nr:MlaD family protein [Prauserella shujinwangii]PRX43920.1 phospholipid/cholesterol/gamma-HCH transport system substrate-binding protein [Prauserella shujinwangii]
MLVRKTRIQLLAFLVISVLAITYALFRFTDVGKVFGTDGYTVRLQLTESGGIFTGAEVTYRGYNIGRVGELSLTADGLQADLEIEPEAPQVPRDLHAVVANRSAVGEQYVDLRPVTDDGPYLENGSVIDASDTTTPVRAHEVIADLNSLAGSVPTDALRTVVDESYDAFRGTGDDLQILMDTTRDFTRIAQDYLPQTVQLLEQGNTVLDTQNEMAGSLRSFSRDLNELSATLKSSDADLRKLIDITPQVAEQVSGVLAESGPGLGALVANLLTTSNLLVTRLDGLEQGLVTYPVLAVGAQTVAPGDGTAHLGLVLNLFDPPSCTKGYLPPEQYRPGNVESPRPPKTDAYCAEPAGSPINVRGSQNAPYHGVPVAPSEEQVRANADRDEEELASRRGVPGMAGSPGLNIVSLRQLIGLPS